MLCFDGNTKEESLNAVILGTGNMARIHSRQLSALPGVRIAAVVSRGGSQSLPGAKDAVCVSSIEQLKELGLRLDFSVICLPSHLHGPAVEALSTFVPHIICEKPAALSLKEAQSMVRLGETRGCAIQVAQVARVWDSACAMAEYLRAERQCLHTLTIRRRQPRPHWSAEQWLRDPARSGGILFDLAIHDIDYTVLLFGLPDTVSASRGPNDESVTLLFGYHNFCVVLYASWCLPESYVANGMELSMEAAFTDKLVKFDSGYAPDRLRIWEGTKASEQLFPTWDPYRRQLEQMLCSIRGVDREGIFSLESALPALTVCDAVRTLISG